jgi:protein HIRA/HIR1
MLNMLRSWDGLKLYAVSSDGTLAAFDFEPEELEGIAPHSIQQQYLQKFGFSLPPLPESWSHTNIQVSPSEQRMTPPPSPNRSSHQPQGLNSFGASSASTGHEVVNTLIAKRNTKKRARQNFLGPGRDSNPPTSLANASSYHDSLSSAHPRPHLVSAVIAPGLNPDISESTASVHSLDGRPSGHIFLDMAMDVPIDSLGVTSSAGAKRKLSALDIEDRPTKARTLGGDRLRGNSPNIVKEIPSIPSHQAVVSQAERKEIFSAPPTLTYLFFKTKDMGDDILECKNAENGGKFSCSRICILCAHWDLETKPRSVTSAVKQYAGSTTYLLPRSFWRPLAITVQWEW